MDNEFTGQYSNHSYIGKERICVGDLITLIIPRKKLGEKLLIFEVIKRNGEYRLIHHSGDMHPADPNYEQPLNHQVWKVVGNIEKGIDRHQFI